MLDLPPAHRMALLAAALLAAGATGPWATGVWYEDPIFGERTTMPREERNGALLLAPALLAAAALLLARDVRVRAWGAAAAFGLAFGACLLAWTSGEYDLRWFDIHIFSGWESVGPGWGLVVATAAAAFGGLASLAALPRRDAWRGAYI